MEKKQVETTSDLATLQKQLICPICMQLFQKPVVILPCQHNLCRKCANELYQPSLFQARTTMTVNSGRFRCPTCRQEVVLDRHGVYGLQRNLLVENIIDAYKQGVDECNAAAARPCPPPAAPPPEAVCSDHEGEKVNIYCLTCQVPTCSLCKVFGAHQSCEVAPLAHVYQQKKVEMREELQSLLGYKKQVETVVEQLEDTCRSIQESCRIRRQSVCDDLQRVCSVLEERQKAMTRQISADEDEKVGRLRALMQGYGESVEANRKLLEAAASSMEDPDMAMFIQNSKELIRKVLAAATKITVQPTDALKPSSERMKTYRYDFSCQEGALRSIDFITKAEVDPVEEPEEAKEPSDQNTEPEPILDPSEYSTQESETEPDVAPSEPVEAVVAATPAAAAAAAAAAAVTAAPVSPGPGAREKPDGAVPQGEAGHPDLHIGVTHQKIKKQEEEEEEEEAEEEGESEELGGAGALRADKEEGTCEDQMGLNPQQAVTVLFYLLAFLLLLQRFWSYIGCFICT